jgi:hypothetical protein
MNVRQMFKQGVSSAPIQNSVQFIQNYSKYVLHRMAKKMMWYCVEDWAHLKYYRSGGKG